MRPSSVQVCLDPTEAIQGLQRADGPDHTAECTQAHTRDVLEIA